VIAGRLGGASVQFRGDRSRPCAARGKTGHDDRAESGREQAARHLFTLSSGRRESPATGVSVGCANKRPTGPNWEPATHRI
jgi:hypothetical protein